MRFLRILLALCCATPVALAQQQPGALERHLAAARDAQAHTNCHLAAQEYAAAVRLMPPAGEASGEVRTNLGIALYCDQQFQEAVRTLHTALHLAPALTAPHLFLGLASYHLGDLLTANMQLTLFLNQSPGDPTANLWLGYTLVAQQQLQAAQHQFEHVLQLQPANTDAAYALGQTSLQLGRQKASALEALDPHGSKLLLLASDQYRLQGDTARADAALAESKKRLESAPADAATAAKEEQLYQEAKAFESKAKESFQSILQTAPDSYRAHEIMADSLVAMQQQERAIPEYESVIRANPTLPGVHESLSQCLVTTGHFKEALAALRTEQTLSPVASARLLTRIGQVQMALGETTEAATSLRSALKDSDTPDQAYLLLARVLLQQGNAQESIPLLQHYLSVDPNSSTAYYQLARAYRITGNQAEMAHAMDNFKRTSEDVKARMLVTPILHGAETSAMSEETPGTQPLNDSSAVPQR
jgi:predicted Zn-dependent protease